MQGIILAAGKGTRLQPVTPARSKAMAPVAGKPIVARVLDLFVQNGIRDILLLISPEDRQIKPYMQQQMPADLQIRFVVQRERLGMAHALTLLAPHITANFLLSACDNLVPSAHIAALIQAQQTHAANGVLSLMEIDIARSASTGIVEWRGEWIQRIVEKPQPAAAPSNIASLPLYLFTPKLLDYLPRVQPSPRGEYELQDAMQLLMDDVGRVTGLLTPHRWQLTNVQDLLALNRHFLDVEAEMGQPCATAVGANAQIQPPVSIEPDVVIGADCVVGPHVAIERGCHIGAGSRLQNAIVLAETTIAPGSNIANAVAGTERGEASHG